MFKRVVLTTCTVWCCELLRREERKGVLKRWFWMMILATAEIYGGTYSPIYSLQASRTPCEAHVGPVRRVSGVPTRPDLF